MPRKKKAELPKAGNAFAVPLEDGRYSVCRVLVDRESYPKLSIDAVLVAGSAWIGSEVPGVSDQELRPILRLNHHSFEDEPLISWIGDSVPSNFTPLGKIEPTGADQYLNWPSHSDWARMAIQPLLQWRWEHEREALLAEDTKAKLIQAERSAENERNRIKYLENVSLKDFESHVFFPDWAYPPQQAIDASRANMTATVRELTELGESASEEERLKVLQNCIETFNELDERLEFIETVERENICWEFEAIVYACGLGSYESLADEWRDW